MKHVMSIFALTLVGTFAAGCAAPTEEEASGSPEENAANEEGPETGWVTLAANLLTACRSGDTALSNRTTNYQGVKLPKDGVFSVCRRIDGSFYAAMATTSGATLGIVRRPLIQSPWGPRIEAIRLSPPGAVRFEEPLGAAVPPYLVTPLGTGEAALGMIDCSSPTNCSTRTSR
jgi:hypothetical protein